MPTDGVGPRRLGQLGGQGGEEIVGAGNERRVGGQLGQTCAAAPVEDAKGIEAADEDAGWVDVLEQRSNPGVEQPAEVLGDGGERLQLGRHSGDDGESVVRFDAVHPSGEVVNISRGGRDDSVTVTRVDRAPKSTHWVGIR